MSKKKIALLGATGSIGKSTIEVVKKHYDKFEIALATAHKNHKILFEYAEKLNIPYLAITNEKLKSKINTNKKIYFGEDKLLELLNNLNYDILLNAVVGSAGLRYTVAGLRSKHNIALANKESLVMAGDIIIKMAKKNECRLIPIDSEHSAIMQCLLGNSLSSQIRKIILTASGGPFNNWKLEDFDKIKLKDTLKHPTWKMGKKITIDSATMANKGLEVIEAHHLFGLKYEQIEVVIHPQSIIHSMVEFIDGSILSQMSYPDMKIPIQFALSYPERIPASAQFTDITSLPDLTFHKVDYDKFPILKIAYQVGKAGGIMPTIFNASNEAAVSLFLREKIKFNDIYKIIEKSLNKSNIANPDLETILSIDKKVKKEILATANLRELTRI
ncbi:MAG: 1-deoxy-D-xylulose-5-phosphate reductoisomerase [Candidatus Cloacimonetes bacterium]|nr:1-deoxy-D-xylulose-5-phosphate reductoisomerase [Candidatus Cloacimonadota bacterium]MBL7085480.1 1-deoxy-D-xylulose-5-phosphate reductoisomerase [Candidatus Cloacimonadota bacterium]